jgi:hypothetical protein
MQESLLEPRLRAHHTQAAQVLQTSGEGWKLIIPPGSAKRYRLAQLDDYMLHPRRKFYWNPPLRLELRARVSSSDVPGTWGFGFWNDPFAVSLGLKGAARRLPVLPNTAWFFHASPPNYLALRDDHPATGLLAAVFSAPNLSSLLLAPALLTFPLLTWPFTARLMRRAARVLVNETAVSLEYDATVWHSYRLELHSDCVSFWVDGANQFTSTLIPRNPLGLVIWIDNQYAAFPPNGRLRYGTLSNHHEASLEIENLEITQLN